jgi:hypothetical protein
MNWLAIGESALDNSNWICVFRVFTIANYDGA